MYGKLKNRYKMFSDRNYNRYNSQSGYYAVPAIIALCVIVFIVQYTSLQRSGYYVYDPITKLLSLNAYGVRNFQIWRLVTYMFVHGGFWHLLINMWGLYLFGSMIEKRMGSAKFLGLFFVSGIFGAIFWLIFNWSSQIPCVGASGALFGVVIAAAMLYPNVKIMLLIPPIPLKLKTFAIIFIIIESFSTFTGIDGQVAHLVHLGGLIAGYVYIRFNYPNETYNIFNFLKGKGPSKRSPIDNSRKASKGWTFVNPKANNLDAILDKISRSGINSLSEDELNKLHKAREESRKK